MAEKRQHELRLRLTEAEHAAVLARADGAPVALWLRCLALDLPAPTRRQVRERPLHPAAAELARHVAAAGNQMRASRAAVLGRRDLSPAHADQLLLALNQIQADLRRALKVSQC